MNWRDMLRRRFGLAAPLPPGRGAAPRVPRAPQTPQGPAADPAQGSAEHEPADSRPPLQSTRDVPVIAGEAVGPGEGQPGALTAPGAIGAAGGVGERTPYNMLGLLPPLSDLTEDELRAALRLRIVALDSLPSVEGLPHLRALAPGVVEVLTIDLPGTVITPPESALAPLGPVEDLVALGREHLKALVGPELHTRQVRAEDGLTFSFLYGEDYSLSSVALVLPAALSYAVPEADLSVGVAVAVPDRQHVAYRPIEGLESLMALGPMAAFARNGFDAADGPVSPEVYWARGPRLDQWEQLTQQAPDGISIHVPAELAALVEPD